MEIEVVPVPAREKDVLANLIELYEYDFSEFEETDVNEQGRYGYPYLDLYWSEARRFPYFIKVDGKLAGFALVCDYCYLAKDGETLSLTEFFVMKRYRQRGIGKTAAKRLFALHPGKWELTVHPHNVAARQFWLGIIEECVGSDYRCVYSLPGVYEAALATAYSFTI